MALVEVLFWRRRNFLRTSVVQGLQVLIEDPESAMAEAIAQAQGGDSRAFQRIYECYVGSVRELCRRRLGSDDAGQDATQEVFEKLRHRLDRYDPNRPFRPWLMTVAANHCLDLQRRQASQKRALVAHGQQLEVDKAGCEEAPPLRHLEQDEQRKQLRRAIEALPEPYGSAMRLRYFADKSYEEIGHELKADKKLVASWLFRARKRLRRELASLHILEGATHV